MDDQERNEINIGKKKLEFIVVIERDRFTGNAKRQRQIGCRPATFMILVRRI